MSGRGLDARSPGWPNYTFAIHDNEETGPSLAPQVARKTGLRLEDLQPEPSRHR